MKRRPFVSVLATAAPATVATLLVHDAAANPPPPKVLPDPPVSAPTVDEAASMVRKHQGLCFAFYPSGGALPVACPNELRNEVIGQAILKNPSGRCQWIPLQTGAPGSRVGYLEACPAIFSEKATANVVPEAAKKLLLAANAVADDDWQPWSDPPQPARLETSPPQQVGCTTSTSGAPGGATAAVAGTVVLAATARRRRRT